MSREEKIKKIRQKIDRIILGVQENKSTQQLDKLMSEIELKKKRKITLDMVKELID